ncbi:MAG: glucose-6-phosphate isomerase [Aestuariivirgaceae bacterium]
MPYQHDISRCMAAAIGAGGLSDDELSAALPAADTALAEIRKWHSEGSLPLLQLPQLRDDLPACAKACALLTAGASDVVLFGTGGSSLGGQALAQLAGYRIPGPQPRTGALSQLRLHFFDNLDAGTMDLALRRFDLKTTRFVAVSKSGGTPETIVQTISVIEMLKQAGLDWNLRQHLVILTSPGTASDNAMHRLAELHDLLVLDHNPDIGGRFSVLSNVGVLPAMVVGLDAEAIRAGAGDVLQPIIDGASARETAPALGAASVHALTEKRHISTSIMMPYSDRLRLFSNWYQQLWAESLGKQGRGIQPVAAAGPVDQHSQMQLFLGGPPDKLLNIIMLQTAGSGPQIPESYRSDPLMGYLAGRTIGDLTDCQQRATAETYARNGRPVRTLTIDQLDERAMGALLMHFMLETIITGLMMDVDPFNQPAVEQSKILTREYLATM